MARVLQQHLELLGQRVIPFLVDHDFADVVRHVVALLQVKLGHVRKAHDAVVVGGGEFCGVDQTAIQSRDDVPRRQLHRGHAERVVVADGQARGADLQALQVLEAPDLLLEPAERLARHRTEEQAHHIELRSGLDLGVELLAAAILDPPEHLHRVHAEVGPGAVKAKRRVLAEPECRDAVTAVEHAFADRIDDLEARHDGAGGQHVDFQPAVGDLRHLLRPVDGELVVDELHRPSALEAQGHRRLRARDVREAERRRPGSRSADKAPPLHVS
jgi:hypothetical protein